MLQGLTPVSVLTAAASASTPPSSVEANQERPSGVAGRRGSHTETVGDLQVRERRKYARTAATKHKIAGCSLQAVVTDIECVRLNMNGASAPEGSGRKQTLSYPHRPCLVIVMFLQPRVCYAEESYSFAACATSTEGESGFYGEHWHNRCDDYHELWWTPQG